MFQNKIINIKNVDYRLLRYLKQLLIQNPYFPTMQALARNNREGDGSAYAFFPSQFLQSPFLRCSHPKWTKTLDELITSFYKYMLFLGDSSTTFYVITWKKLIYFTPLLLKNRTHIWQAFKTSRANSCTSDIVVCLENSKWVKYFTIKSISIPLNF